MKEIVFDTGLVEYSINGKCSAFFNPTDSAFSEKLFNTFSDLDKIQDKYKDAVSKIADKSQIFDITRSMDAEMRGMIDGVLGDGVCEAVFGALNVYALSDGLPIWANLLLAIMDEIDTSFSREQKATNPRIAKYTKKYHK